jgi:hypothetical protein
MTIADELEKLVQLRARGILSAEEFEVQKKRLLEGPQSPPQHVPAAPISQPRIEVPFVNPRTGERKLIKVGFAWPVGLFGTILGIPLFLRGLNSWGAVCLVLWTINFLVYGVDSEAAVLVELVEIAIQIWLGFKANEMTAKRLLETGWVWAEPGSEATKIAMRTWQLGPTVNAGTTDTARGA